MSEISSPRPLPPAVPVIRNTATAADMAVRLLQPLEGMLAAGESAKAEVVAIREQAQSFQLLLKLTLAGGKQATLQAESPRPLARAAHWWSQHCPRLAWRWPCRLAVTSR